MNDIYPAFSLLDHGIVACSDACIDGVGRADTADEAWHHKQCPNHSAACCPLDDPDHIFDIDKVLRYVNQHGRNGNGS